MRTIRFTFLCNEEERKLILALSRRLERTQSDVIRLLIREASHILLKDLKQGIGGPSIAPENAMFNILSAKEHILYLKVNPFKKIPHLFYRISDV